VLPSWRTAILMRVAATLLGVDAAEWAAIATWGLVAIALVAALLAHASLREARASLREAARLRKAQAQPYVAVFADESPASFAVIDLVVKNFGSTAAKDIRVEFDPELTRAAPGEATVNIPAVIPTLVPGQEWRTLWDTVMARGASDLPANYAATVSFDDSWGERYTINSVLDWSAVTVRDVVEVHTLHDAIDTLKTIAATLQGWNERALVGPGLRVSAWSGEELDRQATERSEERRRRRAQQDGEQ
jgi:hypothetical protein